jgi:hypothetical protein
MQEQTKDNLDYTFHVGEGIGLINFNLTENELLKLLGTPDDIDIDLYEEKVEETKRLHYTQRGLMITISMYDRIVDPLKIFTNKLYINGIDVYKFDMPTDFRSYVQKAYESLQIEFIDTAQNNESELELYCPRLGLTAWFQDDKLIDLCLEKPTDMI